MTNFSKFRHLIAVAVITLSFFPISKVQAASYSVVQGDSLYTIGKAFETTSDFLIQENHLNGITIYPGQILQVPTSVYTVKPGDSLYLIAKNYKLSLNLLRKINNRWTDTLYVGEKLLLPSNVLLTNTGTSSLSAEEIDLLSRLISAEASGESYEAKVAVGAVVLNRVKDSRFPNTLTSVIYEKSYGYYQFTPVENGYINNAPDSDSIKAAYAVSSGADPTKGAIYYFDDSTTNKWLWSRPIALRIGKMVYTY